MITHIAHKLKDGRVISKEKPARHGDDILDALDGGLMTVDDCQSLIEGFLNMNGDFLDREQAAEEAFLSGQLKERKASGLLFSEDLW